VNQATNRFNSAGFSYDATGNMTADGVYTYTWDGESRVKMANGVTYTYDGDGKRVKNRRGRSIGTGSTARCQVPTDTGTPVFHRQFPHDIRRRQQTSGPGDQVHVVFNTTIGPNGQTTVSAEVHADIGGTDDAIAFGKHFGQWLRENIFQRNPGCIVRFQ